ncbi:MAG: exopolysaccharide biosynthesis protein [Parvularcula sp.]|jgi:hypothetical protein|nr:exopolysaccharide biosynthesis protein [Parvularcula sp.]
MAEAATQSDPDSELSGVEDVLDRLKEAVRSKQHVEKGKATVGVVLDAFGSRSYGPFLLVPALIEMSPIGGIPGVPTILAVFILSAAVQMLMGRDHIWVPGFFERRHINGDKVVAVDKKVRPAARWLDKHTRARIPLLLRKGGVMGAAIAVILLCLTVPPLELVPFASTLPMAAIACFGLALLARDGLLMLIAFVVAGLVPLGIAAIAMGVMGN